MWFFKRLIIALERRRQFAEIRRRQAAAQRVLRVEHRAGVETLKEAIRKMLN